MFKGTDGKAGKSLTKKTFLDELDIAILRELQKECRITLEDAARKVKAPASTVQYRLKRLERSGVIDGYYAKIDPAKLDMEYITVIHLRITVSPDYYESVGGELAKIPGVWAVYLILGDYDFLVMTRSKDREDFMGILEHIMQIEGIKQSTTAVVGRVVKEDPRLHLE